MNNMVRVRLDFTGNSTASIISVRRDVEASVRCLEGVVILEHEDEREGSARGLLSGIVLLVAGSAGMSALVRLVEAYNRESSPSAVIEVAEEVTPDQATRAPTAE
jgi:hypothetical protein